MFFSILADAVDARVSLTKKEQGRINLLGHELEAKYVLLILKHVTRALKSAFTRSATNLEIARSISLRQLWMNCLKIQHMVGCLPSSRTLVASF